jgi:hypothetical protein
MASLLARGEVKVGDVTLRAAKRSLWGGDEVCPKATKEAYFNQLRQPYAWAAPNPEWRFGRAPPRRAYHP